MPMQIKPLQIEFPELKLSDFGILPAGTESDSIFPRTSPRVDAAIGGNIDEVVFDDPPEQVFAILTGFRVWFQDSSDRPFGNLEVRVGDPVKVEESDVRYRVPVTFGLRDWSGDWDDEHGAVINVMVIGQ